ncbi:hypothetical protein BCR34DRAFT_13241 [Clohesyomyces aquaticus]|uniref:BZIP domain-containing protein n=1 Tax=Clohesyomyces aquaticus TaxID=1231657 RepID=A0A1Y1ZDK5_9PLEO|nr:hypothetical protein BCR34DRAFT_13241 [Clohesyomyces aquaticus]
MDDLSVPLDWDNNTLFSLESWTFSPSNNDLAKVNDDAPHTLYRFGQVTPPNDSNFPGDSTRDSRHHKTGAPVFQSLDATLWPPSHDIQSFAQVDPLRSPPPPNDDAVSRPPKRRRSLVTSAAASESSPAPAKRRRGRPKRIPDPQPSSDFSDPSLDPTVIAARQSHLEKNRVAAHKCRQRQKQSEKLLEQTAKEASFKNRNLKAQVNMLKEEVLELKNEVLRHAGCGFWAIDEYLARCAGDWLGKERSASSVGLARTGSLSMSPLIGRDSIEMGSERISRTPIGESIDVSGTPND